MAKIVKTETQENALKSINSNLKALLGVNGILNISEETCLITISAGSQRACVAVEKRFGDEILQDIRKKLAKETKALARKNAIILDESDLKVLENRNPGLDYAETEMEIREIDNHQGIEGQEN